jgi:flagellar biosynthetic protein FliQ
MNAHETLGLMSQFLRAAGMIALPVLVASLVAGLVVGVVQAATQINEASVSFVVKAAAVVLVLVLVGPSLTAELVRYTRESFRSIATVVK